MLEKPTNRCLAGCLLAALAAAAGPGAMGAEVAKERVTGPIYNGAVNGINANQFYFELKGADKFYEWSATDGTGNALFSGLNNAGVNSRTEPFIMNRTLNSGQGMMFDTIRDKGGAITRKPGPGVTKPSTLQIKGPPVQDVTTKIDPLNKSTRKAVGNRTPGGALEIELTNETDDTIFVNGLSLRVDNFDDPFDFSTPFEPDGMIASLDQPFSPQSLSPGKSLTFTYSGPYNENLPIALTASSTWDGLSFTGTTGSFVPEPGALSVVGVVAAGLLSQRRR